MNRDKGPSADRVRNAMTDQRDHQPGPNGTTESPQKSSDDGMLVLSYILSGILLYGGLGWLGDHYLHTTWLLPTGLILGLIGSMYLIIKRYGGMK